MQRILMLLLLLICRPPASRALDANQTIEFKPELITEKITVDGSLDEQAWARPSLAREFISFYPVFGEPLGPLTEIWLAYDHSNIYFAFLCHDPEPEKIKTSVSKRDSQNNDDWMGILIDGLANRQSTFEFYVNPSGIQLDGVTSATNADLLDTAHDFVWQSAAQITSAGYQVEVCIPLSSLRFKGGAETVMGMMFMRSISRYGKMGAWPEIKAGQNQFNYLTPVKYRNLSKMLNLEMLPNITVNSAGERHTDDGAWAGREVSKNIGMSLKYGMTSAITAEATLRPDFSQVESDALQIEVNQRYPVFYTEKRPFFMEGINAFDFALVNNGMMSSPVYTRFIVDPGWAAKLSGTSGRTQFAVLAADDRAPGRAWDDGTNPQEGKSSYWLLARGKYSLGDDNSIGLLYGGKAFAGEGQHTTGADAQVRFFRNTRLTLSMLHSESRPENGERKSGNGYNGMLQYGSRTLKCWTAFERWDRDFRMDSAFMNRSGLERGQVFAGLNLYPKSGYGLQVIQPFVQFERLHDLVTGLDDQSANMGATVFTSRSGMLQATYRDEKEAWAGRVFHPASLALAGRMQMTKELFAYAACRTGEKIYYDAQQPFLGSGHRLQLTTTWQPHVKLYVDLSYLRDTLDQDRNGRNEPVYRVNIYNLLASYQFNKYFFVRSTAHFNDYNRKILTDLLASFTLIPGTVLHLGYGALYEKRTWQRDFEPSEPRYYEMKNSLFFKASYLFRAF